MVELELLLTKGEITTQYNCQTWSLPIPPFLDWRKTGAIEREYNPKKPYVGLEVGSGIGRGGIGRDDCTQIAQG